MNTEFQMYKWDNWQDIDWKTVERQVFKLQKRIYKASKSGNVKLVHKLQRLLTKSHYGKLLATRKVTQENQGRKTAGVDGVKSIPPKERLKLCSVLKIDGKGHPTRRVWIPKPNGEKRPLGILTIKDRATQMLVKLALEPQWEAKFEENSYGFRPGRACHDAIEAIFSAIKQKPKYVLDADISKCFDKINHERLLDKLETYPQIRGQIKAWLKSGVKENKEWFPTTEGTPQGGIISPLLANIALHGLEKILKDDAKTWKGNKVANQYSITLVRYADDFVVMHKNIEIINRAKTLIEHWLNDLGLELNQSKTRITHTLTEHKGNHGFDFLGFNIAQYNSGKNNSGKSTNGKTLGYKTLITPSSKSVTKHLLRIKEVLDKHKTAPQAAVIKRLNPIIRGWANYYSTVCSRDTFDQLNHLIFQKLWRWAKRRHPEKSRAWIAEKYFKTIKRRKWNFATNDYVKLALHTKVKKDASYYDGDLYYWSARLARHPETNASVAKLLKAQKGKCNYCGLTFVLGDIYQTDHVTPKSQGGTNSYDNLQPLHLPCHHRKSAIDGSHG
jgi:RNA-directed DNA polymerase